MPVIRLLFLFCFVASAFRSTATNPQTTAENVLKQLYLANGNFKVPMPKLVITSENKKVASYVPAKNTIFLDKKTYEICQAFGPDSLSALAFVIGHELVHAFQSGPGKEQTNFLAYDKNYRLDTRIEKVADVQGVFNAYVAGYDVIAITPRLIDGIYTAYNLKGKSLPGYPSLEERKGSCTDALSAAEDLIDVFEASNDMLVIGKYNLALAGYGYIQQYYQGREMYNNIGLAYILSAQYYWDTTTDNYLYPMEADWQSKMDRSRSRGTEKINDEDLSLRNGMLENAEKAFRNALLSDPGYIPARINLVCVLDMMSKPAEALRFYKDNLSAYVKAKGKTQQQQLAELAMGITCALLPDAAQKAAAAQVFERLQKSSSSLVAVYGRVNQQNFRGEKPSSYEADNFELPDLFRQLVKDMKLSGISDLPRILLSPDLGIFFQKKHESETATFVFSNSDGNLVSLIKFKNRRAKGVSIFAEGGNLDQELYRNIIATKDGFYLKSPEDKVIMKLDTAGKVLEMTRYIEH